MLRVKYISQDFEALISAAYGVALSRGKRKHSRVLGEHNNNIGGGIYPFVFRLNVGDLGLPNLILLNPHISHMS